MGWRCGWLSCAWICRDLSRSITHAQVRPKPARHQSFGTRIDRRRTSPPGPFSHSRRTSGCDTAWSLVRVRGLPATAALSEGHSIAPGAWAVSLSALPGLQGSCCSAIAGRSEIVITLVASDGGMLAEARSTLKIAAASSVGTAPGPEEFRPTRRREHVACRRS